MTEGEPGTGDYLFYAFDESSARYERDRQEERLIAYAPILLQDQSWAIGVAAPKKDARRLIRSAYLQQLAAVGMSMLVVLLGSSYALLITTRLNAMLKRDVAEKTEELKESHERLLTILGSLDAVVYVADLETHELVFVNKYARDLFGDTLGETYWKALKVVESGRRSVGASGSIVSPEHPPSAVVSWDFHNTLDDRWYEIRDRTIRWVDGRLVRLEIAADITERKQAEERITASLQEKEVLLKEVHHRVKNNLQVISSLLYLQSQGVKDEMVSDILSNSRDRVRAMALVHEQLYRTADLARIEFEEYVHRLVGHVMLLYGAGPNAIALEVSVDDVALGVDAAIPCGLIINELVSNSLQHAFPDAWRQRPVKDADTGHRIRIGLQSVDSDFILTVADNGIGFPKSRDFREMDSLGLRLVVTLAAQLDGTVDLVRGAGTVFKIRFAAPEPG